MSTMTNEVLPRAAVIDDLVLALEMGVDVGTNKDVAEKYGRNDPSFGSRVKQEASRRYEEELATKLEETRERERLEREAEEVARAEQAKAQREQELAHERTLEAQRVETKARLAREEAQAKERRKATRWWTRLVNAGAVAVLLLSFICSYTHIRDVAISMGQPPIVAYLLPIVIDALLIVASGQLKLFTSTGDDVDGWVYAGTWFGVLVSVAFNVASSASHGIGGMAVGAVPSIALLITFHMIMAKFKKSKKTE